MRFDTIQQGTPQDPHMLDPTAKIKCPLCRKRKTVRDYFNGLVPLDDLIEKGTAKQIALYAPCYLCKTQICPPINADGHQSA